MSARDKLSKTETLQMDGKKLGPKWEGDNLFFFFGTHSMQKFLGQGSNLCHRSCLSLCRDNVRTLTHCTTRELHPFC